MKTYYEELAEKGLLANNLTLELAWTVPYFIGMLSIITFKPVSFCQN